VSIANDNPEALDYIANTDGLNLPEFRADILPSRVVTKTERPAIAELIVDRFCEHTDSLTAFVLLKQAAEILEEAKDKLTDRAIARMTGKKQEILGAEASTVPNNAYTYQDEELTQWERESKALAKKISDRKEALRKATVVNGLGEVCTATQTRWGTTLKVSYK
jgi:hypothetical protein